MSAPDPGYLSGFGGHHETEAVPGTLPQGQNSPQQLAGGLYAEQLSGTPFTAPRAENRRTWVYRIRPSSVHGPLAPLDAGTWRTAPLPEPADPNRYHWRPWEVPAAPTDLLAGITTVMANGDAEARVGCGVHVYAVNTSMVDVVLADLDGELLFVPQEGRLHVVTELGRLVVAPGEICVVPRGVRFRVELVDETARGFVAENHGNLLRLPELGPIGANGLANPRDFLFPTAAFEDRAVPTRLVVKHVGGLWATTLDRSPLDVVAWHGNLAPYKYDLARFNTMNTVSFDHADPSIFTVLTSPSGDPGVANLDFVVFPPRWMVAEHTFRPPWFHRNTMSEFVAAVTGSPESRSGYPPGSFHLHNGNMAHGPDPAVVARARTAELVPGREEALAVMFESRLPFRVARAALEHPSRDHDYDATWDALAPGSPG